MLITGAEIAGTASLDVRIDAGRITEIAAGLRRRAGEAAFDAGGGALLPGLHDHHLHLMALAAEANSLPCGPPDVCDADGLGPGCGLVVHMQWGFIDPGTGRLALSTGLRVVL